MRTEWKIVSFHQPRAGVTLKGNVWVVLSLTYFGLILSSIALGAFIGKLRNGSVQGARNGAWLGLLVMGAPGPTIAIPLGWWVARR